VRHVRDAGFGVRIASRHPERGRTLFASDAGFASIRADINDDGSIAAALARSFAAVNALSLYVERGRDTFRSVHVEAAERLARCAAAAGVERLMHVSGIGADARSRSLYIRSRGEGEAAVLRAFPSAVVIRPSVMFGPDDAFLVPLVEMLRQMPAFPLFGSGATRLQPVCVEDVAEAVARLLRLPAPAQIYELAGPRVYSYRSLLQTIGRALNRRPLLFPVPFALWRAAASVFELLPAPPITRNQVELMEYDNLASAGSAGFAELRMTPRPLEDVLPQMSG
jgi:NADH dehydrogenase